MDENTQTIKSRNFGLDVFRTIAILVVVIGHGHSLYDMNIGKWFPVDGVNMFFVLSGLLIGNILLKFTHSNVRTIIYQSAVFYKRRWFRTLPNYYLFLIINIILVRVGVYDGIVNENTFGYFVFLQNFTKPLDLFFWESWSLAIEEWFYFIFPIFLTIFVVFFNKTNTIKNQYLAICVILLITPLILRIITYNPDFNNIEVDLFLRKIVIFRLDTIAYGLFGAYLLKYHENKILDYAIPFFAIGTIGIWGLSNYSTLLGAFFTQTINFSLQSLFILLCIPLFITQKTAPKLLSKVVKRLSITSYSLYLVHLPVLYIWKYYNISQNNSIINLILYLGTSISISVFIYYLYEKPLTNLRRKQINLWGFKF